MSLYNDEIRFWEDFFLNLECCSETTQMVHLECRINMIELGRLSLKFWDIFLDLWSLGWLFCDELILIVFGI